MSSSSNNISTKANKKESLKKRSELFQKYVVSFLLYGTAAYFVINFLLVNYQSLKFLTELNYTTHQISNLIENIRTHSMVFKDEEDLTLDKLIEVNAIPKSIIADDNKSLVNTYGGNILITPSDKLRNIKNNLESDTFKMSYQGLPKEVCIHLAMMDWGDKIKGLLAVAIGNYDKRTGIDIAFDDIDRKPDDIKFTSFTDDQGKKRSIRQRRHYSMNVTKPDDYFLPTPFSHGNAKSGCKCEDNSCTFALRYTIFGVEKNLSQEQRQNETAFARLKRKKIGR